MKKTLVILGPTAIGKTDLAIDLAKKFNGELVSCDSRQVYKFLDIGTGKAPSGIFNSHTPLRGPKFLISKSKGYWFMNGVKIWMYDVADPNDKYNVSQYVKDANKAIQNIIQEGRLPILVGGTGLYLKGLLEGFSTLNLPVDEKLRENLKESGVEELQKKLQSLSPIIFQKMNNSDKNNSRRLIRQIEISTLTDSLTIYNSQSINSNVLKIGLNAPRSVLNTRINKRVLLRFKNGMLEEAEQLLKDVLSIERMKSLGLEYRVQAEFLNGEITYEQMVEKLQNKIHQYAKRQMTWFKKEKNVSWFDITEKNWVQKVEKQVMAWYNS